MQLNSVSPSLAFAILSAAQEDSAVRALLRIDMSSAAGRAGVSTTSVRTFLRGETLGVSAKKVAAVLMPNGASER